MTSPHILQVALPVPLPILFDYLAPQAVPDIPEGTRVLVPFGRKKMVGVVVGKTGRSEIPEGRLLTVLEMPDGCEPLLDTKLIELLRWCWKYYKHAPGDVIASALPPALRKVKGRLPGPVLHYSLTGAGVERLAEPVGRAPVQYEMLGALASGPRSAASLSGIGRQWRVFNRKTEIDQRIGFRRSSLLAFL